MIPILIEVLRTNHWCDYNVSYIRDTAIFGGSGSNTTNPTRRAGIFLEDVVTIGSGSDRGSPLLVL